MTSDDTLRKECMEMYYSYTTRAEECIVNTSHSFHESRYAQRSHPNDIAPDNFTMNDFVLILPIEMGLLHYCIHFREGQLETQDDVLKVMHENKHMEKQSFPTE